MSFRVCFASVMRKIAGYLTKNRNETGRKIAQSTHENEYIKPEKTFCRNSKQFLNPICIHSRHRKALAGCPNCAGFQICRSKETYLAIVQQECCTSYKITMP